MKASVRCAARKRRSFRPPCEMWTSQPGATREQQLFVPHASARVPAHILVPGICRTDRVVRPHGTYIASRDPMAVVVMMYAVTIHGIMARDWEHLVQQPP